MAPIFIEAMNFAALVCTASRTCTTWQTRQRRLEAARQDDNCLLSSLGRSSRNGMFDCESIVDVLQATIDVVYLPEASRAQVSTSVASLTKDGAKPTRKALFALALEHVVRFNPQMFYARWLRRWCAAWEYFPDAEVLASRASRISNDIFHQLPPCVCMAVLKTWCNGWCTSRRSQKSPQKCLFGCCNAADELEHYMECSVLSDAFLKICTSHAYHGPLGMLELASENESTLTLRAAHIYVAFTTHKALRHLSGSITTTAAHMIKARWIELCGRSKKIHTARLQACSGGV